MYYEEVDLCRRLLDRGVVTRFVPFGNDRTHRRGEHRSTSRRDAAGDASQPGPATRAGTAEIRKLLRLRAAAIIGGDGMARPGCVCTRQVAARSKFRRSAASWRAVVGDAMAGWHRV